MLLLRFIYFQSRFETHFSKLTREYKILNVYGYSPLLPPPSLVSPYQLLFETILKLIRFFSSDCWLLLVRLQNRDVYFRDRSAYVKRFFNRFRRIVCTSVYFWIFDRLFFWQYVLLYLTSESANFPPFGTLIFRRMFYRLFCKHAYVRSTHTYSSINVHAHA